MERVGKKSGDITRHLEVLEMLGDQGISTYVNLLYGIPGEAPEQVEETINHFAELVKAGNIYRVAGRIVTPLPNSRWYFELLREIDRSDPSLKEKIENSDTANIPEIIDLWINKMTHLKRRDIERAHSRLVEIAEQNEISISSKHPRGIV